MKSLPGTLTKSLVKPFYQQMAGIFLFAMIVLFGAVGKLNGQDLLGYHLFLIRGILTNLSFLFLVFVCWLVYVGYCWRFVARRLNDPAFEFLLTLYILPFGQKSRLLLFLHALLLLPVIAYAFVMIVIAASQHLFLPGLMLIIFVSGVLAYSISLTMRRLAHPGISVQTPERHFFNIGFSRNNLRLFLRFLLTRCKALYFALKIAGIGMLWFLVKDQHHHEAAAKIPVVFFSIIVFGHGLILHAWRETETQKMAFLPGLSLSLHTRFFEMLVRCIVLLAPESIVLLWWTPSSITAGESASLIGSGYALLLLENSLLYISRMSRTDYLKLTACIYFLFFLVVLAGVAGWMIPAMLALSAVTFFRNYYRYE